MALRFAAKDSSIFGISLIIFNRFNINEPRRIFLKKSSILNFLAAPTMAPPAPESILPNSSLDSLSFLFSLSTLALNFLSLFFSSLKSAVEIFLRDSVRLTILLTCFSIEEKSTLFLVSATLADVSSSFLVGTIVEVGVTTISDLF